MMFQNLCTKLFPTPKFLSGSSFGLDVSDQSLRFVELLPYRKNIVFGKYGEKKIPAGVIESGKIKKPGDLEKVLYDLRKEAGIRFARVSLPEEQIYVFELHLEKKELKSIEEGIELCLEEHIPIQAENAVFDYEILEEGPNDLYVQVNAIVKSTIESYLSAFKKSGISIIAFEPETQAIVRALLKKGDKETCMIVDFGERRTGIFIVSAGIVMFSTTIEIGGAIFSEEIQKRLHSSFEEADQLKQKYGLKRDAPHKEISDVLLEGVSALRNEIQKHYVYWHTSKDENGKDRLPIEKIIFCGGEANLVGLEDYFSSTLKTKIELGNVWINLFDPKQIVPEINFDVSLSFVTTVGLALGDFEK